MRAPNEMLCQEELNASVKPKKGDTKEDKGGFITSVVGSGKAGFRAGKHPRNRVD